ncbi:MAG: hypothetical protein P8N76_02935 [Pirellulaceae bacterium]|nr:hypothetical protein [Pirellulaceae bacterium]
MPTIRKYWFATSLLCVSWMVTGCAPFNLKGSIFGEVEESPKVPSRIVAMWTDTVLYQDGKPGVRGFGARVYFYGPEDDEKPIEVDGSLTVYAFNAEQKTRGMPSPEKKFIFTADQFKSHHSQTKVGHSYSIWLPWDELGGTTRHISLITRFEHRLGGVVVSDPSKVVLPGLSSEVGEPEISDADGSQSAQEATVQQAAYEMETPQAITIQVPPRFAEKFHGSSPSELQRQSPLDANRSKPATFETEATMVRPDSPEAMELPESVVEAGVLPYHQRLSGHFQPRRYPVENSPGSSPVSRLPRKQPYRARWLSGLPPTPRSSAQSKSDAP